MAYAAVKAALAHDKGHTTRPATAATSLAITGNLIINTMVLVFYSLIAPFRMDAAKSKPLIGFFGLFTATIATVAGFGFCCYIGVFCLWRKC